MDPKHKLIFDAPPAVGGEVRYVVDGITIVGTILPNDCGSSNDDYELVLPVRFNFTPNSPES